MSHLHAFHIEKLKNDFTNIITLKREIAKVKSVVADKLSQLKKVYNDLIKTNSKKIFLFCLDSFYFQYKTFAMEMEHIDRYRTLMNNRMYCDYYKLYNIIITHIKENRTEMNVNDLELKTYPVYKDLEPFLEYKLDDIKEIHENILLLINQLYSQSVSKEDTIVHYNDNHHIGFSISNFLNTLEYENRLLQEQINLYINYVSFFHISQKKQLTRLHTRMQDFYKEVDDNININRTFSIDDIADEDRLHKFYVIGEEVQIESILEDTEFLMDNTERVIGKINNNVQTNEISQEDKDNEGITDVSVDVQIENVEILTEENKENE
jgi:hypothetical protein